MLSPAHLLMCGSRNFCPQNFNFARFWGGGGPAFSRWSTCLFLWKLIELVIFQGDRGPDPLLSFGSAHASSLKLSSHTNVFQPLYTVI